MDRSSFPPPKTTKTNVLFFFVKKDGVSSQQAWLDFNVERDRDMSDEDFRPHCG